jgi:hypothetical protein
MSLKAIIDHIFSDNQVKITDSLLYFVSDEFDFIICIYMHMFGATKKVNCIDNCAN